VGHFASPSRWRSNQNLHFLSKEKQTPRDKDDLKVTRLASVSKHIATPLEVWRFCSSGAVWPRGYCRKIFQRPKPCRPTPPQGFERELGSLGLGYSNKKPRRARASGVFRLYGLRKQIISIPGILLNFSRSSRAWLSCCFLYSSLSSSCSLIQSSREYRAQHFGHFTSGTSR